MAVSDCVNTIDISSTVLASTPASLSVYHFSVPIAMKTTSNSNNACPVKTMPPKHQEKDATPLPPLLQQVTLLQSQTSATLPHNPDVL